MRSICFITLCLLAVAAFGAGARAEEAAFQEWVGEFKQRAIEKGISPKTVEAAFANIHEDEKVVALDQKQPDGKLGLEQYINNLVTKKHIRDGRQALHDYHRLLAKISRTYGVQPKYIVALWGIESNYGKIRGKHALINSLATLAYEGRRADFFGDELLAALKVMEEEGLSPEQFTGSWAGAMGQCQFMPRTYLKYAADGNGDGKRDIWNSEADVFASIASYLNALGWDDSEGWGYEVQLPEDFRAEEADISLGESATYWQKRGLMHRNGKKITGGEQILYAMYPGTEEEGAMLVTNNYKALLDWNRSRYFATAVVRLADAIGAKQ